MTTLDKKLIWICPLCTRTFRDREAFRTHLKAKIARADEALTNPDAHAKEVRAE